MSQSEIFPTPPSTIVRVGTPRLDRYQRLIARLYEAMILLCIEQPIQGPQVTVKHDNISLTASRRRLTTGLAHYCDWDKGGRTTTSIGIEDSEESSIFWVASNQGFQQRDLVMAHRILTFLGQTLRRLQDVTREPDPSADWLARQINHLARSFAAFATPRIRKEASLLSRMATSCIGHLNGSAARRGNVTDTEARDLERWLKRFQSREALGAYDICMLAYISRNDRQMDILLRLSQEVLVDEGGESLAKVSYLARHYVGRLADHIRVSKHLVEDALRVREVLDVFQVSEIHAPLCVQPPEIDSHTNLDSILGRMIPKEDEEFSYLQKDLSRFKNYVGLEDRIKEQLLKLQSNPPIVHCEVQVLEHFHRNGLRFTDDDRFIGTSKFSCFCCKLYYRHHPSRPVEPDAHEQIYLNWGPINLPEGSYDLLYRGLRDTLNPLIRDVRDAFFRAVRNKNISAFNRPNSITGLTRSIDTLVCADSDSEADSEQEGGTALNDS
ncbi:hypothetical protein FCIRC_13919 [Fusarium circinatum]|uniref:Uncharacterized protein n=1 Tax=Fusarium circinatum TaxID=48490 RepID=A0A8H5WAF0_FUSCI|nr:hypothetical protein FCIRC_13919 [Fusarium circinatum]